MFKNLKLGLLFVATVFLASCKDENGNSMFNIFSLQDEVNLGKQTRDLIASNPQEYPLLDSMRYRSAYDYLNEIRNDILATGQVGYKDQFEWKLYIVNRDDVVNAFCTPGGYIYVYTGLIKYLDNKSSLAGVIGHEMAHADKRHSTEQLTKKYGVETLLQVVLGNNANLITQIGSELIGLSFSRSDESEADEFSVRYLCPSKYHADGAANFFMKIENQGGGNIPAFLSTHPNPANRVSNIQGLSSSLGCSHSISSQENDQSYIAFKNSLP